MAYKPDKHGRDHCPGGEDPIPCLMIQTFRASLDTPSITGITGTMKNVDWNAWQNGDESVFEPRKTTGAADPVEGVDLARVIRCKKPGRYTFTVGLHFSSPVFDSYVLSLNDSDATYGYADQHVGGKMSGTINTQGFFQSTFSRIYPMINLFDDSLWPDFTAAGFAPVYFGVAVIAASGQTVDLATLEIHYEANVSFPA